MHESQLARAILREVLARAAQVDAARVLAVRGRLAETEAVSRDSLVLSFTAMAIGTPAEGARLELSIEHVVARCRACRAEYKPEQHVIVCPRCGDFGADLLGSTGLVIEAIDVDS
ncbi:MAG: hydrogenase maturation nickel metallochaperone HypA [Polyangiaceae bacterium]